ncbi:hypothetical protein AB0C29_02865 [Actinoplanes sp. NPDC048791]|uniref:5'-methylthioadenosine/S-adenosylhomocysteine nucleosidase family protein n=1 Tax=Actinoplanes sp. NPDC048791 TaxID=3154623 RepID=UPI0033F2CD88
MINFNGGMNTFGGSAVNYGTVGNANAAGHLPGSGSAGQARSADVGVLTVLVQEIRAVREVLQGMHDFTERRLPEGPLAREAWIPAPGGQRVRIAAMQTLRPGTDSAALAYRVLVDEYNPSTVLLVGIAGGVGQNVHVGDVVISDEVIAYDARRETPQGVHHRGQAQSLAGPLAHRLNDFFTTTPARLQGYSGEDFQIHRGPIGSGNAVVTDAGSEIRWWLKTFNEKVLAVETEAAGVAQSFLERMGRDSPRGWLTIRGISDTADRHKGHQYHDLAAYNAAAVMAMLAPHLTFDPS